MLILGLEASTTSAKAMIYSTTNGLLDVKTKPFNLRYETKEIQEVDEIYKQVIDLGRRLCTGRKIDMIAVSSTWQSVLLLGKDMKPQTSAYLWSFSGAREICHRIREDTNKANALYRKTGAIVNASYPSFKLMFLREMGYDLSQYYIMGIGSYFTWRLTGQRVVMDSMASGSGLFNIHTKDFDDEILSELDIRPEQLSRIVPYHETLSLSEEGAMDLGISAGIPVLATGPDGGLDQVGAGALQPGIMTFSVGTSGSLRVSTDGPHLSNESNTWCYLSPVGVWLSGIGTSGCCNCVDWEKKQMFSPQESYSDIEKHMKLFSQAPIFLPFLFGERGPGWADERKGCFCGLDGYHTRYDCFYSVLEGVLMNLYQCYQLLCKVNGEPHTIKLSGGILNSPVWMQMCADIFGKEMEIVTERHSSLFGSVLLALHVLGRIEDLTDISKLYCNKKPVYIKPAYFGDYYKQRYEIYLDYYHNVAKNGLLIQKSWT